jgi:hypothetical protein
MPARKVKKPKTRSAITYVRLRPEEKEALQRAADELDEDTRVTESALARRFIVEGLARRGQQ